MTRLLNEVLNFTTRHAVWIAAIVIGIFVLIPYYEIYNKVILIVILLGVALGWTNFAVYSFTKINFTKRIMSGEDGEYSKFEQIAAAIIVTGVLLGVHILVGLAFYILTLSV